MATVVAVVSNFNNGAPVDTATVSMAATSGFGGIPVMPKIATLTNAFTSSLAYPWALGSAGGGTESTSGGQLSLNVPAATANANAGISTWDSIRGFYIYYDLTESSVVVQLVSVGATDPTLEVWAPQLIDTSGTWWGWHIINGQIQVDIQGSMLATATYSPTTHAWLRIREHAGITYFDYSPNGAAWTNFASMADIGAPQLIRPNLFTGSNAATNPASSAIFDNFNLPPVVNKIATLQDAFTTLDTTKWTPSSANISVVSGQLNITNPAGSTTYSQLYSGPSFNYSYYDLTESAVAIKLVSAGNQALASLECYPLYLTDETYDASPEKLFWYVNQGQIAAYQWVNGVQTRLAGATYSPVTHAWLRIRETAGTVYFETSPNGDSWASFTSTPDIPNITVLNVWIQNGTYASEASTTICLYDNLNLPPLISGRNYSLKFNRLYQGASVAMAAQTNLAVSGADVQFSTAPLAASAGMGIGGLVTEKVSPALSATASMTVTAAAMTTTGTVFAPTHLLTAADADFETGVGSWAAVQYCSIAQTTAAAHTGSGALAITSTVATSGATAWPQRYAVIPGQVYKASFWAMAATNSRNIQCQLVFYDTNLAVIPGSGGTALMGDQVGTWQQFGAPPIAVAPPNAVWADVLFVGQGAIPVNEVHYIDTVTLDQQPGGVAGLRVSATNITGLPNLLTPEQSGFEGGTNGGLTGISLTFANVTTPVHSGVHALQISTPQSSGTPAGYYTVPVTPGQQLAASGWAQAGSAALTTAYMSLAWIDASMSALSTSVGASVPITTSGWSYMTAAGTAPASAAYVRVTLNWPVTSGGLIIYWDDLSLSQQLNLSATAGMTVGATNIETASVAMSATTTTLRVIPVGLKFNTLTDDFSGSISSGKWALYSGPVATGGQLVLNMPANNPQQWGIASGSPYRDLTESYVVIQTVSISIIQASFHLTFKVVDAGTNGSVAMLYWEIFSTGGVAKIRAYSNINGYVGAAGATGVNYDPVAYAWLRIREHAGAVYFDYSPDGNIWTNWTAAPDPPSMTYMSMSYLAYTNGAEASATTVTADNFNLPPAVAPTLSATAGMTLAASVKQLANVTLAGGATLNVTGIAPAPPVTGFAAWYDASKITGVPDNTQLTNWPDLSGNGNNLVQTTQWPASLPTFYSSTPGQLVNGLPTVQFNGGGTLICPTLTPSQPYTVCAVAASSADPSTNPTLFGSGDSQTYAETTTGPLGWYMSCGTAEAEFPVALDTHPHALQFLVNDTATSLTYDGATQLTTTGSPGTGGIGGAFNIGAWVEPNYENIGYFWIGPICEMLVYPFALSAAQLVAVNTYLTHKWLGATGAVAQSATAGMTVGASVTELGSVTLSSGASLNVAAALTRVGVVNEVATTGMVVTPAPVIVRAIAILGSPLNVLAGDDSSFEGGGIGSWQGQNTTLANTTAVAQSGTHSLAVTATTTTGGSASTAPNLYPAIPGFTYTAQLGSLAATTGRSIMCQIVFFDAGLNVVGTVSGNPFSDQTGTTWQILGASGVAPPGSVWQAVYWINNAGVSAVGEVHYVDLVVLKQAAGATSGLTITPTISRTASVPLAATSGMILTGSQTQFAPVALAANAGLSLAPIVTEIASVPMAASAGMTLAASVQQLANVVLAGGAALNVAARVTQVAQVTEVATAGMTVVTQGSEVASVPLVATASLTIAALAIEVASVPLSASAGLTVAASIQQLANVVLAGGATLNVSGLVTEVAAVSMAATAGLTVAATTAAGITVTLGATAGLTVAATITEVASVALSSVTTLTVTGLRIVPASVVLSGTSGLTVAASIQTAGVVAFSVAASMFISTTGLATATVVMSATTTLVTAAQVTQVASVGLVGASSLTVAALVTELASVALSATAALTVAGVPVRFGTVSLSATAGFSLAPLVTEIASIALSATASLTVAGSRMVFGTIPMTGTTTLIIGTTVTQVALVAMAGNTTLAISARTTEVATVAFVPTSTLIVGAAVKELAAVALSAQSILVATAIVIQVAMVVMSADTDLDILGVTTEVAGVAFLSATALLAPGTVTEIDSGIFKATSKMTVVATVIVIKYAFRDLVRAGAQLYPYPAVGATPETSG